MDTYVVTLLPVLVTALIGSFGWVLSKMVQLSAAVAVCVDKVDAINVQQARLDERIDAVMLSR